MSWGHDNPPPGYAKCTRAAGHDGPCAHPFSNDAVLRFECPDCCEDVYVDEDGCCALCGSDTLVKVYPRKFPL